MSATSVSLVGALHDQGIAEAREAVSGRSLTTYCIGGPCEAFVEPNVPQDLRRVFVAARACSVPCRILGAGSNLLISDDGLTGITIRLGRGFRTVREVGGTGQQAIFEVGAAYSLMTLSRELSERGLAGLEFAGGIPASLGGAVRMNAGAHGGQMSDVLDSVCVMFPSGEDSWLPAEALQFSYRHSMLPEGAVVIGARVRLRHGDPALIREARLRALEERKSRQPLTEPSAGSVFKNPDPQHSAGYLIEQCGLKGQSRGGAIISPKHANWITNPRKNASSADVEGLMTECREVVAEKFGIVLEREVLVWRR